VGLDLYVKLLEQTILELKGEEPREAARATLNLRIDLRLPEGYVPEVHQRMSLYKRISQAQGDAEVARLRQELRDRYGALPPEAEGLLAFAGLRLRAEAVGIAHADRAAGALHLRFGPETPLSAEAMVGLVRALPGASLSPAGVLTVPLPPAADALSSLSGVLDALEAAVGADRALAL